MRVRIIVAFAEAWSVFNPGQEIEVDAARGVSLIQLGVAERIDSVPETAAMPDRGERAVRFRAPQVGGRS